MLPTDGKRVLLSLARYACVSVVTCVLLLFGHTRYVGAAALTGSLKPFRPPAVPLVTVDPYMSVWSFSDNLYDSWPVHWTGAVHAMSGMVRVDGRAYRFMGPDAVCPQAMRQKTLLLQPTQSIYRFTAAGVELKLTFTTPFLPADFDWLSCPVTFLTYEVRALDGKEHQVSLYFDATAEWVVNDAGQEVTWYRSPIKTGGRNWLVFGSTEQPILAKSGDNIRIDWGYFYVGVPDKASCESVIAFADDARNSFSRTGHLPPRDDTDKPRPANRRWPVIAVVKHLSQVGAKPQSFWLMPAYNDIFSIEYMHRKLRPWWFRQYGGFNEMLADCLANYDVIRRQCDTLDRELMTDARMLGGERYARLISLAYRQAFASGKVVVGPDDTPWFFHKECFSNGCMATVDVSYPASPFFALLSPTLLRGMMMPIFEYAESEKWPYPFSPHDIGKYPKGNGQAYRLELKGQMPVEESGNMILMMAEYVHATSKTGFVRQQWQLLSRWADYLREKGLDPENQLCTDDFTGHLAHNANLSVKAINALGAYGWLCEKLGDLNRAGEYKRAAHEMAVQWQKMADDGDHYRLTFDRPATWSMKYNLVWDNILGLNLFPDKVAEKEVAFYLKKQNRYGLPLDLRADFTKSDWLLWCATLADNKGDFERLITPLYRFVNESPDRVPFSDWYFTSTAKVKGFRARPVIGGLFIKFLTDDEIWHKWASRDGAGDSTN